jgi:hypothetical protein
MKKRTIAINPEKGIFLGSVAGYAVFSKTDPFGIPKAFGFDSPEHAKDFFATVLPLMSNNMIFPVITTNSDDYVSCVDIIKQGYEEHTYKMMDYLDMPSTTMH